MSNPTEVVAPTVNNNGSDKLYLKSSYKLAYRSLGEALEALRKTTPNARDFQTAPAGAYVTARAQHDARVVALENIRQDMVDINRAIDRQ